MRYHLLVMQLFKKNYRKKRNIMSLDSMHRCVELWNRRALS